MKSDALIPFRQLATTLSQAARGRRLVVAAFFTSPQCPWCVALLREQLEPRVRSDHPTRLLLVEFNLDSSEETRFPDGKKRTARQWGTMYGYKVTPTVVMIDQLAKPLINPLIGYASRDFYAAYLEEQITQAEIYWQNRQSR